MHDCFQAIAFRRIGKNVFTQSAAIQPAGLAEKRGSEVLQNFLVCRLSRRHYLPRQLVCIDDRGSQG
jgi:hypothetical protein